MIRLAVIPVVLGLALGFGTGKATGAPLPPPLPPLCAEATFVYTVPADMDADASYVIWRSKGVLKRGTFAFKGSHRETVRVCPTPAATKPLRASSRLQPVGNCPSCSVSVSLRWTRRGA